jgi:hypothetical protein
MELNRVAVSLSHLKKETNPVSETLFYSYLDFRMMNEVHKQMILNEILNRFSDFQTLKTVYM